MKAFHFCHSADEATLSARGLIHSIAYQLACNVPQSFEAVLDAAVAMQDVDERQAGGSHVTTAFAELLEGPLNGAYAQNAGLPPTLVVIDGVDKMPPRECALLLGLDWEALPLRVLLLSRDAALSTLRGRAAWVDLQQYRAELESDVELYARAQLQSLVSADELDVAVRALVHHSGKSFLYMRMIVAQVVGRGGPWTAQELWELPANLEDIFEGDLAQVMISDNDTH